MTQPLHQSDRMNMGSTLQVIARAMHYVRPFRGRFAFKIVLTVLTLAPTLFLGIPVKVILDHVVLGTPILELFDSEVADAVLAPLAGLSREQVLYAMIGLQLVLIFLIGMFGTSGTQRDLAQDDLSNGQDDATRSENRANDARSYAGGLLGMFDYRFMMKLTQDLNHYYRASLFHRVQTLPMTLIDDERIGDAVYRVMYDTPSITEVAYRMLLTPIVAPIQIVSNVAVLYVLFPNELPLVWLGLSFLPLAFLVSVPFSGAIRRAGMRSRGAGSSATSTIEEGMSNIVAVQSLGASGREQSRFESDSWSAFGRYRSFQMVRIVVFAVAILAGAGITGYGFVLITDRVIDGVLSPGDFTLLLTLFSQVLISAASLGRLWVDLQSAAPGLNRVFFLMDQPCEEDPYGARKLPRIQRGLELSDLDFDYPDGTPALRQIDLQIPVGKVTALCGPAGAGKTTLAYMLPRFLSPTRGVVRADGVDLERVRLESLRSQMAFVFQENALFDATVAENIRMARPDATDAEVTRAAQVAGAHEFILRLPEGYDTRLGRGGGKLSVGQKQRLSIARALVRQSAVLVLDEPTSALDPETEVRLVASLREASRDRAVVVIAHRLSTIRSADQIVFLDHGRILESGTHGELMALQGEYARFVALQTQGAA